MGQIHAGEAFPAAGVRTGDRFYRKSTGESFIYVGGVPTNSANWIKSGTAVDLDRQFIITGNQFRNGVTAPTDVTIGTTPTIDALHFDAVNELVSTFLALPFNVDPNVDPQIILIWSLSANETDGDELSITMDYTAPIGLSTGSGVAKTSTQLLETTTVTTANGLAIGDIYTVTFTLDVNDADNPLANAIGLAIELHLTNLVGVAEADLIGACVNFRATY